MTPVIAGDQFYETATAVDLSVIGLEEHSHKFLQELLKKAARQNVNAPTS